MTLTTVTNGGPSSLSSHQGNSSTNAIKINFLSSENLEQKTRVSTHLLAQGGWDLFLTVYRLHDPAHRQYDRSPAGELDPIRTVYRGLDKAIGEHLVWSPKTGVVYGPDTHWRTGDHRPDGLLLASGPGFTPGTALPDVDVVDLGATLSAMLGVELTVSRSW